MEYNTCGFAFKKGLLLLWHVNVLNKMCNTCLWFCFASQVYNVSNIKPDRMSSILKQFEENEIYNSLLILLSF